MFTAFDTRTGKVYHTAGQRKRQVGFITLLEPVHYSWMNQVEQWFSILQRKRLGTVNFADKKELAERLDAFVPEWNSHAHAFRWSSKSFSTKPRKAAITSKPRNKNSTRWKRKP